MPGSTPRTIVFSRETARRSGGTASRPTHQFIDTLILLYQTFGFEVPDERRQKLCDTYNHLLSGVVLFGPPSVRESAYAVNEVYTSIWPALTEEETAHPDKPSAERWRDATGGFSDEFGTRISELVDQMHADVTHGIAEDPRADRAQPSG